MSKIIVRGGKRLSGTVRVSGAKNAVLPILAATLLAKDGESVIHDVPNLDDVMTIQQVLTALGGKLTYDNETMRISAEHLVSFEAPMNGCARCGLLSSSWDRCSPVSAAPEFRFPAAAPSAHGRSTSI